MLTVLRKIPSALFIRIWKDGKKNQNKFLIQRLLRFFLVYLRLLYWDHFFLTFTLCDLFLENSDIDIANYADNYSTSSNLDSVIFKLQKSNERIFRWFHNNNLISNAEKSHLIVSSKENLEIQVSGCSLRNEGSVKLLGVDINNNFNFDYQVSQLCRKASKKLHVLASIAKYMYINQWRMLMKAFVSSQYS